jgi:hypothetical protein
MQYPRVLLNNAGPDTSLSRKPLADLRLGVFLPSSHQPTAPETPLAPLTGLNTKAQVIGVSNVNGTRNSIVVNDYGNGKAIYVGTSIGLAYENLGPSSGVNKLIYGVLNMAKVQPYAEVDSTTPGYVEVRLLRSGGDT